MTVRSAFKSQSIALSIGVLLVAMVSLQIGAAVAKRLFPIIGSSGATTWRLAFAACLLFTIWRPWRVRPTWPEARSIVIYGLAMGAMNFMFYAAISRIPLGIAVAVEFTGPLALAMATSRRAVDFLWIALAAFGLIALLPLGRGGPSLDAMGVALALAAGVCWALYIVFGRKAGAAHGGQSAALGTLVAALAVAPFGIAHAGMELLLPAIVPAACAVGVLSSALPYSLEMIALTRLPTRTFGVLMSAEPAIGALSGLAFLGEALTAIQWIAIVSIMAASAGSAATSRSAVPPPAV